MNEPTRITGIRKHFVTYTYPGSFFSEDETKEITAEQRDPERVSLPKGAISFRFFDRIEGEIEMSGEPITVRGRKRDESTIYYPGGRLVKLEEVIAEHGEDSILASNMKSNQWEQVVQTRRGTYQPAHDGACIGDR